MSTFVSDRQGNESRVHLKKYGRPKYEDFQSVTLGDEYVARAAVTLADKSNVLHSKPAFQQDIIPEYYVESSRSREDMLGRFKSGCLLPEFPELRDSYDQFCTILSEQSSHEELEAMRSIKNNTGEIGTNCSKYCSDEILDDVHSCKHRKKTILEEASNAHEKYQRWSMPEFTKLWYETADSDTESAIISEAGSIKEQCKQFSADQSTQVLTHPISCPNKSNGLVNSSPHATQSSLHVANQACDEVEERISGTKLSELSKDRSSGNGKVLMKESLSCPAMVSTQSLSNFCASGYDSFDFFEDSQRSSTSPSPTNSCILVENSFYVKNPEDMNESTAKENSSTCEVSVCASDSGYSGMSNGARDSPEGEEQDRYDPLSSNHLDILTEPELFKTLKHLQEKYGAQSARDSEENSDISSEDIEPKLLYSVNSFCDTPSKTYLSAFPDVIVEKGVSQEDKDKRCAELMQEYKINKNSYPRTTRNSLYRTYEI